jgi:demethylmenaquinone methyltransferase/2-methoxy-6-polyprenyl-1,4-benzoquinol methylase
MVRAAMPDTKRTGSEPSSAEAPAPLRPHPLLGAYYSDEPERRRRVRAWFDESAPHYDWITQAMSLGSGHWYRRRVLSAGGVAPGARVLDVACGTGVLAEAASRLVGPQGGVVGLDPSAGMLARARGRGVSRLVLGVAEALPFPDGSFDLVTMGYALRHVADLGATFSEYRRVLRPGGRVLVLEITRPQSRLGLAFVRFYLGRVIPALARAGGGAARELFRYYWDTIENCVPPATIIGALAAAGFAEAGRDTELALFSAYRGVAP